jgi:integrase
MVDAGICRLEVNRRIGRIVRAFKWAVENELIPAAIYHSLKAVSGLRQGRTEAKESKPVKPAPEDQVDAIESHVARQVWAMVKLQQLTGMRPGEVTAMRTSDLDTSGDVWSYTPGSHKTEHHGRDRIVFLGPKAQEILRAWLRLELKAFLFQPRHAMAERWAEQRDKRQTRMTPSHKARQRRTKPKKTPGERYTTDSYRHAIAKGCEKANVPSWHPHQLRHNAATRLRHEFGLDVARVILGHSSPAVTEVYAEADREKALAVMGKIG